MQALVAVPSPHMNFKQRCQLLEKSTFQFTPYTGKLKYSTLKKLCQYELGNQQALDKYIRRGNISSKAIPNEPILHITSGNTPHSTSQNLIYAIMVGGKHYFKISSKNTETILPLFESLHPELRKNIQVETKLPERWIKQAKTIVIYGNQETAKHFLGKSIPQQRIIIYGNKISIACIFSQKFKAYQDLAKDICLFNQQSCLATQNIYIKGNTENIISFGKHLAKNLDLFLKENPPSPLDAQEIDAISQFREKFRFLESSNNDYKLWQSEKSSDWTIVYENSPILKPTCLNQVVYLRPMPSDFSNKTIGKHLNDISSITIYPFKKKIISQFKEVSGVRFCQTGKAQNPSFFWHNGGNSPLQSLITWQDIE